VGWSDEAGRKANAHNLLLWRGIDYLKKLGIERLDLGGVNTRVLPGISRFKLGTGGRLLTLAGTYF
jgi:lipid II:glycine glycyltransferase (peptidoglycan interpeptide bridge formation enzyme)